MVCFFLILCFGCKKESSSTPKTEYIGLISMDEGKDYLLFQPGSFWVYKNSLSNELDTIVLRNSNLYILEWRNTNVLNPDPYSFDAEYISYNTYSLRDSANYNTYCTNAGISRNAPGFYKIFEFDCQREGGKYYKNTSFNDESTVFFYPFYTDEHKRNGTATCLGKVDSISLNSKTYYDVVSFSVEQDVAYLHPNFYVFNHGTSIYHWAKNIGLIKIEHQSYVKNMNVIKFNWALIDSHVIK